MAKFKAGDNITPSTIDGVGDKSILFLGAKRYFLQCDLHGESSYVFKYIDNNFKLKTAKVWTKDDIQPGMKFQDGTRLWHINECFDSKCVVWYHDYQGTIKAHVEDKEYFVYNLNECDMIKVL